MITATAKLSVLDNKSVLAPHEPPAEGVRRWRLRTRKPALGAGLDYPARQQQRG